MRYPLAFVEAYEAQGWRNASRDKLKPNKELETAHRKIATGKQALIDGLRELLGLKANEPQVPALAAFEDVHCSRCGSTDVEPGNDILLCDSIGCHRAYHQHCQTPIVVTIPAGEEPWFCEVCLAVFECLKVINSVFGAAYETVDGLFPELDMEEQQAATDASSVVPSGDENPESGKASAEEEEDEEDDEDFVCNEDEEDEGDSSDGQEDGDNDGEEVAVEVPESAEDLKYLTSDDVIDLNHRSTRSQAPPPKKEKRTDLVGERVAKFDRKTNEFVVGVIAEFQPPTSGKHSRWRVDYRDGSTELLTGQKLRSAMARAASMNTSENGDDSDAVGDATLIVHGKRKRNEVDYRQLNELMFAGKGEDSEEDETFDVKDTVEEDEEDEDDEEDDEDEQPEDEQAGDEGNEGQQVHEKADNLSDQSSPTTVAATHQQVSAPPTSNGEHPHVNYLSMDEGLLNPC